MNAIRTHLSAAALLLAAAGPATLAADDEVAWIADSHGCKVANTFPRPGETITWSGSCSNGYADGDGVLQWFLNGDVDDRFEGHLQKGWAEGQGVLAKVDGSKYAGAWKHSMQEGVGRYDAPDGSWYEGQWKNGMPNGQGEYHSADGRAFAGEWVDGVYQSDQPDDQEQDDEAEPNKV